jgi:hypothetical protein
VDDRRVPNSGSHSMTMTSDGSPVSSVDKRSLVYQLQKLNGMEKKRRSRTRRDQPATNKPGQPYQKRSPYTRTSSSMAQSTSPGPSDHSSHRRKDAPRVSRVEAFPSSLDPLPSSTSSHEYGVPYLSTTSPPRSSSPSSPYYPGSGTSSSSPGLRNLSPPGEALPIPISTSDHFQHMALATQSTPDSISPSSPGYHELQKYSYGITGDVVLPHSASQATPVNEPRPATLNDIYGINRSRWNEYGRQQGRVESSYPRSTTSYLLPHDDSAPQSTRQLEQTTTASPFPPMSHGLGILATVYPSNHFYSGYEDRVVGAPLQNVYLLTDHSPNADPSTTMRV